MSSRGAAHRLTTTGHVVLGLVGVRPMAGYELAAFAARTVAHMWPIAKSQVYGELARLEEMGLVTGSDVAQERLPDKRSYSLTDAGQAALESWLDDPTAEQDRFRSSALVKLFFAGQVGTDAALRLIDAYEASVDERLPHMKMIVEHLDSEHTRFAGLTALCGLRHMEAAKAWAQEARARLQQGD